MSISPQASGPEGVRAPKAPLGTQTGSVSPLPPSPAKRDKGPAARRRMELSDMARVLLPDWRVADCHRFMLGGLVTVQHHPEHGSASYAGLNVCGSVWVCPVCAARIGAKRAAEIERGVSGWVAKGGQVAMLTLTLRHRPGRRLAELNAAMNRAYRLMRQGRAWQEFEARYGLAGSITAREYTHGANGWHPHLHVLFFFRTGPSSGQLAEAEQWLAKRWRAQLAKLGEDADLQHGTDLRPAERSAGKYIAKLTATWSLGSELAAAAAKRARGGNRTPAQLLESAAKGDHDAGELFREYANATYGNRWITWSRGLRELCGLVEEEKTDGELAAEQERGGVTLLALTRPQWAWVLGNELRGLLIQQACAGDAQKLSWWLIQQGLDIEPWQVSYEHGKGVMQA